MDESLAAYRASVLDGLRTATLLVDRWRKGDCTLHEFVGEYGDYYHYEALDGHEANDDQKQVLADLSAFIELHEKITFDVVDAVYLGDGVTAKQLEELHRVGIDATEKRLKDLCHQYDIEALLKKLSEISA